MILEEKIWIAGIYVDTNEEKLISGYTTKVVKKDAPPEKVREFWAKMADILEMIAEDIRKEIVEGDEE